MKTTIEIEDALLMEAKAMAARRRTTLKAIIEHALRREIHPAMAGGYAAPVGRCFEVNEEGIPLLKRTGAGKVTSEQVHQLMDEKEI